MRHTRFMCMQARPSLRLTCTLIIGSINHVLSSTRNSTLHSSTVVTRLIIYTDYTCRLQDAKIESDAVSLRFASLDEKIY